MSSFKPDPLPPAFSGSITPVRSHFSRSDAQWVGRGKSRDERDECIRVRTHKDLQPLSSLRNDFAKEKLLYLNGYHVVLKVI